MAVCVLVKCERGEPVVVCEEVVLLERKLKVEDIEELALDAANITLAEDTGAECPVDVL